MGKLSGQSTWTSGRIAPDQDFAAIEKTIAYTICLPGLYQGFSEEKGECYEQQTIGT